MVLAHACSTAGTANFIIPGLGNFPHDLIIDMPVKAVQFDGSDTLGNCMLLCEGTYNDCHLQLDYNGDWRENTVLYDEDLPFLYAGEKW